MVVHKFWTMQREELQKRKTNKVFYIILTRLSTIFSTMPGSRWGPVPNTLRRSHFAKNSCSEKNKKSQPGFSTSFNSIDWYAEKNENPLFKKSNIKPQLSFKGLSVKTFSRLSVLSSTGALIHIRGRKWPPGQYKKWSQNSRKSGYLAK